MKISFTKGVIKLNRTQKLKLNTIISIVNRITILISGLILPRFILLYYGSETNGMVSSITQFLSIITFLDLGVGAVIQSALYRPLANKDNNRISAVLIAAKGYFRRIAYALILYAIILIIFYPLFINESMDFLSTAFLIFSLSLSLFARYYFGILNELLLNADQRNYVQLGTEIIVIVLNLLASVFLILQGAPIQIVKLVAGLIYLVRPVYLAYYVNKHFDIDYDLELTEDPLPHKWSGMGQHIAYSVQSSTDIVVLTIFSTFDNISIYSIYNMVVNAVKILLTSLTDGITSFFGDLLANEEYELLNKYFSKIEWLIHTLSIYLFGMTAVLINQFVAVYTVGVEDVHYHAPTFAFLLVAANIMYTIRIPYRRLIFASGHFKQTQMGSYIEAGLNIVISLALVNQLGLVGVAIGTLISMTFQTIYLVIYNSNNIIFRPVKKFIQHLIVDVLMFTSMIAVGLIFFNFMSINSIIDWITSAIILGTIFILIVVVLNQIFYKDVLQYYIKRLLKLK